MDSGWTRTASEDEDVDSMSDPGKTLLVRTFRLWLFSVGTCTTAEDPSRGFWFFYVPAVRGLSFTGNW